MDDFPQHLLHVLILLHMCYVSHFFLLMVLSNTYCTFFEVKKERLFVSSLNFNIV